MFVTRCACLLTVSLLLGGCAAQSARSSERSLDVVAGFYPLAYAASAVGGHRVAVTNLTRPGGEPHDIELLAADVAHLNDANLVLHLAGFQPAVDDAISADQLEALDAADEVDLLRIQTADEHEGHGSEPHSDEGSEDGTVADPHFWLDPTRLADLGDALAERFSALDPAGATTYAENAAAFRQSLETLHKQFEDGLAQCRSRTMVVSHQAFGYLASRYDLHQVPIRGLSPDQEPSLAKLGELTAYVDKIGADTVYVEPLGNTDIAAGVAASIGVGTVTLDPLERLGPGSVGDDYLSGMRANLNVLRQGQSCT